MLQPMLRHAVPDDIDDLVEIEVDAGRLFHLVDMPEVAADIPDRDELARIQAQGRIWVAADDDHCAAYIVASTVDGHAHIDQVSVRPSYSRQGIGRRLVEHVEDWGRRRLLLGTTLTTFRDVPWNAPYYRRLGYRELTDVEIGPQLTAIVAHESSLPGLDPALRCVMGKPCGEVTMQSGSGGRPR